MGDEDIGTPDVGTTVAPVAPPAAPASTGGGNGKPPAAVAAAGAPGEAKPDGAASTDGVAAAATGSGPAAGGGGARGGAGGAPAGSSTAGAAQPAAAESSSGGVSMVMTNAGKFVKARAVEKLLDGHGVTFSRVHKATNQVHGFVGFATQADADAAVAKLAGVKWKGRKLLLKPDVQANRKFGRDDRGPRKRGRDRGSRDDRSSQRSRIDADSGPPKSLRDQLTPLWAMPYAEQLTKKQTDIEAVIKKCAVKLRDASITGFKKAGMSLPKAREATETKLRQPRERGGLLCPVEQIIASPVQLGYRNKVTFTVGLDTAGKPCVGNRAGLYREGNVAIAPADVCSHMPAVALVVAERMQKFVEKSPLPVYDMSKQVGFWRQVTVRVSMRRPEVMVVVGTRRAGSSDEVFDAETLRIKDVMAAPITEGELARYDPARAELSAGTAAPAAAAATAGAAGAAGADDMEDGDAGDAAAKAPTELVVAAKGVTHTRVTALLMQVYDGTSVPPPNHPYTVLDGDATIREELLGLNFQVSADSFFQVNSDSAELLYNKVREWAAPTEKDVVLDVCCGTGTIGLTMATAAAKVVGVDLSSQGIEDARRNAAANGITNATFICAKAEDAMKELVAAGAEGDDGRTTFVGIVDPPRGGLHPSVTRAIRTCKGLDRLVYVSCNPTGSFITDAVKLCAPTESGSRSVMRGPPFRLVKAQPVDLFPQTPHIELVALFERDT